MRVSQARQQAEAHKSTGWCARLGRAADARKPCRRGYVYTPSLSFPAAEPAHKAGAAVGSQPLAESPAGGTLSLAIAPASGAARGGADGSHPKRNVEPPRRHVSSLETSNQIGNVK